MVSIKFPKKRPSKAATVTTQAFSRPPSGVNTKSFGVKSRVKSLEEELELIASYSMDAIYRLRYDTMKYDYISPAITRLLGFSVEEMRQVNFRTLIQETRLVTDGMKTVDSFDELELKRKEGDVNKWEADYLIRTKDGRKVWVADVSYPWFDETGNIIGSVGSLRDVTDRVRAETEAKEELAQLANTDALTGLHNRRKFFDVLDSEILRMQRTNNDIAILLVDIDHFKNINDTYGHDVGDMVLVEIGKIITACLRETDLAARLGGEEFGVFLPDTASDGGYWVAERIRLAVLKHNFVLGSDKKPIGCTVSIGVASAVMGDEVKSTDLYKIADTRLYIAKNTGRNQVSMDEIMHTH